jgi:hypothetical protein
MFVLYCGNNKELISIIVQTKKLAAVLRRAACWASHTSKSGLCGQTPRIFSYILVQFVDPTEVSGSGLFPNSLILRSFQRALDCRSLILLSFMRIAYPPLEHEKARREWAVSRFLSL